MLRNSFDRNTHYVSVNNRAEPNLLMFLEPCFLPMVSCGLGCVLYEQHLLALDYDTGVFIRYFLNFCHPLYKNAPVASENENNFITVAQNKTERSNRSYCQ